MSKLPLDDGVWSGEIVFQSSTSLNIDQKATCQLDIEQSKNATKAKGIIKIFDKIQPYRFSCYISSFDASANMTALQYIDSRFGNIWGKLVFIEASYLILGVSEDYEYSFTLSIEAVDATYLIIKGFTLYDQKNILSWSLHLNKLESSVQYQNKVLGSNNTKPPLKQSVVPQRHLSVIKSH